MIPLTLTTFDDVALSGRRWLVSGSPRAAVVIVHGFTASAECPKVSALAELLHATDLDVVTYDARGHGRSGGESTLGDLERHDVAAAVELARERAGRVVVVGASMGAIAVLRHAVGDAELTGVVSVSCPSRWKLPTNPVGLLSALMTRTPPGRAIAARLLGVRIKAEWTNPEPPIELAARLGVPAVFVHGTGDRFIGSASAAELHGAAGSSSRQVLVPEMGHAFEPVGFPIIADAVEWLLRSDVESVPALVV